MKIFSRKAWHLIIAVLALLTILILALNRLDLLADLNKQIS